MLLTVERLKSILIFGWSLDTILGCISCLLSVLAMFISSKAYSHCRVIESSLNDTKTFKNNSYDCFQKTSGDIINYYFDPEMLTKVTASSIESSLNMAFSVFDQQSKRNMEQILERTRIILEEQKTSIAGFTKIDWINIYFENAKITSDEYLQNAWAKVLAKELSHPGSFGYKTLDVLKNLSSEVFRKFETLCSLEIDDCIFIFCIKQYGIAIGVM